MSGRGFFKAAVEYCGVLLLVAALLPIAAIGLFILRFVVLGAAVLVFAALIVAYCLVPAVRQRTNAALDSTSRSDPTPVDTH